METIILSVLLMAGSAAGESGSVLPNVRAQAEARATIIRGESVSFKQGHTRAQTRRPVNSEQTYVLPIAYSKPLIENKTQLQILEFY